MHKPETKYWQEHPITKKLISALTIRKQELSEALLTGAFLDEEKALVKISKIVGAISILNEVLSFRIIEPTEETIDEENDI